MADNNFLDEDGVSQFAEETKKYIDKHADNDDIHVTADDKTNWNGKQDALSSQQIANIADVVNKANASDLTAHTNNAYIHVTSSDRNIWNHKQNALSAQQLSNIADVVNKANVSDLSAVATSGSYNDLSDKPTIPTVNNATLIIQKNGTTVKTFTANASSNVTANIVVPTKTSELTNDSGFLTTHNPVDSDLSSISTNAVQNKVVNTALNAKANVSDVVHNSGAETISGVKTFSDGIVSNLINGKTPELIEEQGNNYIRYSSGIQICWGEGTNSNGTATVSYPASFSGAKPKVMLIRVGIGATILSYNVSDSTTSVGKFKFFTPDGTDLTDHASCHYLAIGLWK